MNRAAVYFTDFRMRNGQNHETKLRKLMQAAGMDQIDFEGKYVAIKIHFGELGNLAFLRPNFARYVADYVKELGGRPFLTDANTLYVGSRKNALDHLDTANLNGFNPMSTGCQILSADGLKGTDDVEVPIEGGIYCETAKIGRAVMDADIVISLNHFKGHECTGFGGALKNLGMGCGSRAGKMEMHSAGKPYVDQEACIGCRACAKICAHDGPQFDTNGRASIDHEKCVGCGRCIGVCPRDAVQPAHDETFDILNAKIAEYAKAVVSGRPCFHINIVNNVAPNCDCHGENDAAIVNDVGMFASYDPVAIDVACADAVNRQPVNPLSILRERAGVADRFMGVHPTTNWRTQISHAEQIGLGSGEYELITI